MSSTALGVLPQENVSLVRRGRRGSEKQELLTEPGRRKTNSQ